MKQRTKDLFAIIFLSIVVVELLIYQSDLNFSYSNTYIIIFLSMIISIGISFWYSRKLGNRILLTLATIGIGLVILFFEFVRDFSGSEKRYKSWEIDKYEIIYESQEYLYGPGSKPYLKLREKYFFGLFYMDIDKSKAKASFLKLGMTDCKVEFEESKTEFDLCDKKQLK